MKEKLVLLMFILASMTAATAAISENEYVVLQTSDISGGNAFEQGKTIQIDYAVDTNVGGTLYFEIDGQTEATHTPTTGSSHTYTYRMDTSEYTLGEHTYSARFVTINENVFTTEQKAVEIVNATQDEDTKVVEKVIEKDGTFDNQVEFPDQTYTPSWGVEQTKNFEIVNHVDEEEYVTVEVPDKPGCQYIDIQTNYPDPGQNAEFSDKAVYKLPPVSTSPSKSSVSVKPLMKINPPTEEQFEDTGLNSITCKMDVEGEDTGQFIVTLRPTDNVLLKTYTGVVKAVSPDNSSSFKLAGMELSFVSLMVYVLLALVFLGAGAAWLKQKLDGEKG